MKYCFLLFAVVFTSFLLNAEIEDPVEIDSPASVELNESSSINDLPDQQDVFIDKDGDGIADDRTFRERKQTWKRSRIMSERIRGLGSDGSGNSGGVGNKAKQGGHGNGPGNDQGNGNG